MKSIKYQIILFVVLFSIIISGCLGVFSFLSSKNALTDEIGGSIHLAANEGVKLVASKIENQLTFLETVAANKSALDFSTTNGKMQYLKEEAERMGYQSLAYTNLDGTALRSDGETPNVADREYFILAKEGTPNVSDVLISKTTGDPSIIYAVPIIRDSKVTGVLYGVRDANEISNITNEIVIGDTGYTYIINGEGITTAHPNEELVVSFDNTIEDAKENEDLRQLANLESKMILGETGVGQYTYGGTDKLMGYAPVPGTDWSLAVTADMNEILEGVNKTRNIIIILAMVFGGLGIIIAVIMGKLFADPIIELTTVLEKFGDYDLTLDENNKVLKHIKRKDEIGKITRAVEKMQNAFVTLLKQAVASSEMVGATSQELSASVQEISSNAQHQASNTEEVSSSMEEMTAGIHVVNEDMKSAASDVGVINQTMDEVRNVVADNSRNLEDINHSIGTILESLEGTRASIHTIADKSRSASEEADGTVTLAVEGKENLNKTVNQMSSIQNTILNLSEVINGLGESASQIGDITNLIKDVAEQTNLLALNASIEAARAGEHGKGFAVVAQAIGDLADESQNATKEITNVIKKIQSEIAKAVENSKEGTRVVESGTHLIQETSGSMDKIFEAIQLASNVTQEITSQMDVQSKDTNEVYHATNDINARVNNLMAAMEEETASAGEIKNSLDSINQVINDIMVSMEQQSAASVEVSSAVNDNAAGIEEISSGSEEIARSAEELARSAQELIEQVRRFNI